MIQQTSLDSWLQLQSCGKINANQTIVVDVFRNVRPNAVSAFDVATMLGWSINRVTPRLLELRQKGRLVHVGFKVQLETGRRVMLFCLAEDFYLYENNPVFFERTTYGVDPETSSHGADGSLTSFPREESVLDSSLRFSKDTSFDDCEEDLEE